MAANLLDSEPADQLASDLSAHDVDELVRRIEHLENRLAVPPWVTLAGVGFVAFACCVVILWLLMPLLGIWSLLASAGLVDLSSATVAYTIGRHDGRVAMRSTEDELSELLQLLRQTAPALVQQGKLSELRWATIKIQLSRYGI